MAELSLPAPAKINLFMNILGRRPDGYHDLQTVYQLLDFCDTVDLQLTAAAITCDCPGLDITADENLVVRAAKLLRQSSGYRGGVHIGLTKRIPAGAGLGGGSSDAATTLVGLNRLWSLGLIENELAEMGAALGADVPVFVRGRSAWGEGIGERLQPLDLIKQWFVLVVPDCQVSTAEIFAHPDLTRHGSPITIARFLEQGSVNVCEPLVRRMYPPVDRALRWLSQWGTARMTGTGSCVFLAVGSKVEAVRVVSAVPGEWFATIAEGLNVSPLPGNR